MAITLNGTTGITNDGGYTGDGVSFADTTPSNTLVTTTGGNVGIGTNSPAVPLHVVTTGSTMARFTRDLATDAVFSLGADNDGTILESSGINAMRFFTSASERMRIDSSGNLLVGTTTATYSTHQINRGSATGATVLVAAAGGSGVGFFANNVDQNNYSGSACAFGGGRNSGTGRSINVGGTVNASGADYAEYMTKAGDFVIAKGDVVGIDLNGKLTKVFADSVSFCVKSTDPSYVGNDKWGIDLENDELEAARQTVDRIAFAGQVPVNVIGATAGQYIIPVNDNGLIKGEAVSNPTFEQYQIAVGKVIAIESDGRAKIIVKVA